jgi:dTDP-4-amino-4,6-dideoxygalactose transaminase
VADYIATKRRIAHRYNAALQNLPGITPMPEAPWATSSFWLYTILVDEALYGRDSRSLLRALADSKIQTRPLWQPMHQSEAHAQSQTRTCVTADRLVRQGLSLPCSVGLTDEQQETIIRQIHQLASSRKQA